MPKFIICFAFFISVMWLNNTSLFMSPTDQDPKILSHRGIHQTFAGKELNLDTCTAQPIAPPAHSYIENTLPSMQAAFELGAEVVELDVHLTPDKVFAVFHDWTIDCRTNGTGQTNKITYDDLRTLDLGHGYSTDGSHFPLRGSGVGMMPNLAEVLARFPTEKFLINYKSNKRSEGKELVRRLRDVPAYKDQIFGVYGGDEPTNYVINAGLGIKGFTRKSVKRCVVQYTLIGWSGFVPRACRNQIVMIPSDIAPYLWGWPLRFQARMSANQTDIVLVGPLQKNSRILGIDSPEMLDEVAQGFTGYIWSNDLPNLLTKRAPQRDAQ
ncbi:glycerophosphodiester phosphodiesterase family protein [Amylibacter marinus]|nr:glycerophosphodiester phosphodiesterase family protein [Amylibacter marinus]